MSLIRSQKKGHELAHKLHRYKKVDEKILRDRLANKCNMNIENLTNVTTYSVQKTDNFREELHKVLNIKIYKDDDKVYDIIKLTSNEIIEMIQKKYEEDGFSIQGLYVTEDKEDDVIFIKMKRSKLSFLVRKKLTDVLRFGIIFMFVVLIFSLFGL